MYEPELVGKCVAAMFRSVSIPITVKCRIGIDAQDPAIILPILAHNVYNAGCERLIVHARRAHLAGLSPHENRNIPPLEYLHAYKLRNILPNIKIIINGGILSLDEAAMHLSHVDGVMLGRSVYQKPYILADVDRRFYGVTSRVSTRHEILERFLPYIEAELARGVYLHEISRHILGLFQGLPGSRAFRRYISDNALHKNAGVEVIQDAMSLVSRELITA
jgi:tRNA-dihydrouridine synthase A